MVFAKQLRPRIKSGRIRSTIRIWTSLKVKVGGRYRMDDGHVVVDSIEKIRFGRRQVVRVLPPNSPSWCSAKNAATGDACAPTGAPRSASPARLSR
jgi:hypothetical protein